MLVETLRFVVVGALLVVVPGFFLVQATFPPGRGSGLTRPERAFLSVSLGIVLLMLIGLLLGFLPHEEGQDGHYGSLANGGAPNMEMILLALSALLFYVGIARGAYPRLTARFPKLVPG